MPSPPLIEEQSTPISRRNLASGKGGGVEDVVSGTLRDQRSPQSQSVSQLLQEAQDEVSQVPCFDYSDQSGATSAQSLARPSIRSQQEVVDLEVPSVASMEKLVSPINRPVRKRAANTSPTPKSSVGSKYHAYN